MALDNVSIEVFDRDIIPLGVVERMTALRWTDRFFSYGEFELWAPLTAQNVELLQENNYVWISQSTTAGKIEYIEKTRDDSNNKQLYVKGRHLLAMLRNR